MKMELDTGNEKKIKSLEELEAEEKAENDRKGGIEDMSEPVLTTEEGGRTVTLNVVKCDGRQPATHKPI